MLKQMACQQVHTRGPRWPAAHRVSSPPADHLEQRQNSPYQDPVLVRARTLLVCAEEKRTMVWKGWTKLDDLGFTVAKIHNGWF